MRAPPPLRAAVAAGLQARADALGAAAEALEADRCGGSPCPIGARTLRRRRRRRPRGRARCGRGAGSRGG